MIKAMIFPHNSGHTQVCESCGMRHANRRMTITIDRDKPAERHLNVPWRGKSTATHFYLCRDCIQVLRQAVAHTHG